MTLTVLMGRLPAFTGPLLLSQILLPLPVRMGLPALKPSSAISEERPCMGEEDMSDDDDSDGGRQCRLCEDNPLHDYTSVNGKCDRHGITHKFLVERFPVVCWEVGGNREMMTAATTWNCLCDSTPLDD
jgi:hypothetical protein